MSSSNYSYRPAPVTPRGNEGKNKRAKYLANMEKRIHSERASHVRAPMSPRSNEGKVRYRASLEEHLAKESDNLDMEQSGQNQECTGQGCMGKLKSGLSRISKAVGMSGGRKHTLRRKTRRTRRTRRTHRKTRR